MLTAADMRCDALSQSESASRSNATERIFDSWSAVLIPYKMRDKRRFCRDLVEPIMRGIFGLDSMDCGTIRTRPVKPMLLMGSTYDFVGVRLRLIGAKPRYFAK